MIYLIIDHITYTITNISLSLFLCNIHKMNYIEFTISLIYYLLISNNFSIVFLLIIIYLIDYTLSKYINYNYKIYFVTFLLYYTVFYPINRSLIYNIIFSYFIYKFKYNKLGDLSE